MEPAKMDPELKARWVAALRSGRYKQGIGALCYVGNSGERRFCCLGVLADIAVEGDWIPHDMLLRKAQTGNGSLGNHDALLGNPKAQDELIYKNDTEQADFNQIADYIAANL